MAVEPGEFFVLGSEQLHKLDSCFIMVELPLTGHMQLSFPNKQHPSNTATCLLADQVEHTQYEQCSCNQRKLSTMSYIAWTHLCFLQSWRGWGLPLQRLNLSFKITVIEPQFMICYKCFQKVFVFLDTIKKILHN